MVRLLSSHIVANYTEAPWDLTGVTAGSWSEQYRDVEAGRRKRKIITLATSSISSTYTVRLKFW